VKTADERARDLMDSPPAIPERWQLEMLFAEVEAGRRAGLVLPTFRVRWRRGADDRWPLSGCVCFYENAMPQVFLNVNAPDLRVVIRHECGHVSLAATGQAARMTLDEQEQYCHNFALDGLKLFGHEPAWTPIWRGPA
jgi:hypothetical protein